ncbi:hypothetical protein Q7689_00465 [Nocardiopsis tropica]|nr:hypothetical protein [Nocardiopsis tropica]
MSDTTKRTDGTPDDPCPRTDAHMAHRNWHSDECGVCPGVTSSEES